MATEYPTILKLELRPIGSPWVRVGIDNHLQEKQITTVTTFEWEFDATDNVCLTVEHFGKQDTDPTTAVEIVGISFYDITDPKFAWAGTYYPDYPEMWYNEQADPPSCSLPGQTYLGWNGVYKLHFSVPIFTWMHNVLNLGWIYK